MINDEKFKKTIKEIPNMIENIIKKTNNSEEIDISPIIAGLIDIGEGFYDIYYKILPEMIVKINDKDFLYDKMADIYYEFFEHLLPHLNDMKEQFKYLVESLE